MLSELKVGDAVEWLDVLIEKKTEGKTKSDKPYLRLTIRDLGSSVEAVLWDYDPTRHDFPEGVVVKVLGEATSYNGTLQVTLKNVMASDKSVDQFAKRTRFEVEALWKDLVERVEGMTEPLTKSVAEALLIDSPLTEGIKKAPAARGVHNAWYGGLLEHIISLCKLADVAVPHYQVYCPKLSKDKVLFGLMLHDAGKVIEYDYKTPAFVNTAIGELTPHMVMGPFWVGEKANLWWQKHSHASPLTRDEFLLERALLMHVLAAHHGQVEWGSPVVPKTLEAVLVHHLDNLDAKMLHALDYVTGKPGQVPHFSEKSYIERVPYYQYR